MFVLEIVEQHVITRAHWKRLKNDGILQGAMTVRLWYDLVSFLVADSSACGLY